MNKKKHFNTRAFTLSKILKLACREGGKTTFKDFMSTLWEYGYKIELSPTKKTPEVKDVSDEEFKRVMEEVFDEYGDMFKRLADK